MRGQEAIQRLRSNVQSTLSTNRRTFIESIRKYGSLHYEHLHGDKERLSSVRVNDQYRIEFTEDINGDSPIANICNIIELSNHYK